MRRIFLLLSVFLLCSTNAEATIYEFSGTNPTGQRTRTILPVEEIFASYNDVTTELIFRVTFAPGEQPNAFTLVLNDGPEPRDQDDVALFFFDYTRGTPTLTANVYDGTNGVRSYLTQPSLITANDKPNGTPNIFVTESNGQRTFGFSVNGGALNNLPAVAALSNFNSIGFNEGYGIWFHWYVRASTTYGANGELTDFSYSEPLLASLDGANRVAVINPEPASLLLMGSALLGLGGLRRKKQQ